MTRTRFLVHMDAGENDVVWWAESDDVPGLSVAADTLAELHRLVIESASIHAGLAAEVTLHLTGFASPSRGTTPVEAEQDPPTQVPASHAAGDVGFVSLPAA